MIDVKRDRWGPNKRSAIREREDQAPTSGAREGVPVQAADEEEAFHNEHCSLMVSGVEYTGRYLDQVRSGKMPIHGS